MRAAMMESVMAAHRAIRTACAEDELLEGMGNHAHVDGARSGPQALYARPRGRLACLPLPGRRAVPAHDGRHLRSGARRRERIDARAGEASSLQPCAHTVRRSRGRTCAPHSEGACQIVPLFPNAQSTLGRNGPTASAIADPGRIGRPPIQVGISGVATGGKESLISPRLSIRTKWIRPASAVWSSKKFRSNRIEYGYRLTPPDWTRDGLHKRPCGVEARVAAPEGVGHPQAVQSVPSHYACRLELRGPLPLRPICLTNTPDPSNRLM